MNAIWIITVFYIIDDMMQTLGHHSHALARVPDSEVLTIAIVSAKYFQNHHERAMGVLQATGYLSGRLSTSRFDRRLHALADWLPWLAEILGETFATGEAFVIDSLPVPVCALGVAVKFVGASTVDMVRPKTRNSLVGVCIWSAPRRENPCALPCSQRRCTASLPCTNWQMLYPRAHIFLETRDTSVRRMPPRSWKRVACV
jgi:hypothetical protein